MIGGLRSYAEMKASGLPWLGDVPAHWDVRKLRHCGSISGGMTPSMADRSLWDGDVPWVTPKDMKRFTISAASMNVAAKALEETSLRLIPAGSVLLVVRGMILARRVPVARTDQPVTINQDMKAIVPAVGIDAGYLAYRMDAAQEAFVPMIDEAGHGTKRFPTERWKELQLAVPPLDEQRLIVRFLDWHGAQTAKLIRAKKRIIALLNEQKQAIIHRAVTRGLDPNVRLKPSGIPWLGDVPEGWEVRKLASLFGFVGSGTTPSGLRFYYGGIPWVMSGDLNNGLVKSTKRTVTDAAIKEVSSLRIYPQHSLIVAMYGATIGKTGVLAIEACSNQACCVLASPRTIVNVEYVQMFVNLAKSHLVEQGYGGGQPNINAEIVKALRVPVPPLDQQEWILRAVRSGGEDKAIQNANSEIALIQEFRTRLIVDVVTGKLDVRAAAANLPETVEPEAIDDLVEGDDLDEAVDDAENEEVAA